MSDDDPELKFRIPTWVEEWLKKGSIASYDTSNRGLTSSQRKGKFSEINFISLIYLGGLDKATETG
jgi:hypothetical protein